MTPDDDSVVKFKSVSFNINIETIETKIIKIDATALLGWPMDLMY